MKEDVYKTIFAVFLLSWGCLLSVEEKPCLREKRNCPAENCPGEHRFSFIGDFLWWRSENHGFSYAFNRQSENSGTGKILRLRPDWDPGFRIGAGWDTDFDSWDLVLIWTWYRNTANDSRTRSDLFQVGSTNQGFYPQWPVALVGGSIGSFDQVNVRWRMRFNDLDLVLARTLFLTQSLSIRPGFGARASWIRQKFRNRFVGSLQDTVSELKFFGKDNYKGIGPFAGMRGEWQMLRGFSILGKIDGALLYGQTRVQNRTDQMPLGSRSFAILNNMTEHFNQLIPNMEILIGIQWGSCFWNHKSHFSIHLSWEASYWWDRFNIPSSLENYGAPLPSIGNQPLTMEGFSTGIEVDF